MDSERIVAVGLLTTNDVRLLGPTFDRLWPVEGAPTSAACFGRSMKLIATFRAGTARMKVRAERCVPSVADSRAAAKQKLVDYLYNITRSDDRLLAQDSR